MRKIEILSPRYKSYNGISLNSSYGQLKRKLEVLNHELLADFVVFRSPYFPNAQFWLDKKQLLPDWWDVKHNRLDKSKIPEDIKIAKIFVEFP